MRCTDVARDFKRVAQQPEAFSYDADGNLTNDGRWAYLWDGENRLVTMTVNTNVGPQYKLSFAYDPKGRRIQKTVATNSVGQYTNNFLYDGWNLIAELRAPNSPLRTYMWGSDLSGLMQGLPRESGSGLSWGAGGVGGLLEATYYGGSTTNCFPAFDGNGNVAALVNAADGTELAAYEYGPFGEVIRTTGPMAKLNPIRWSTKYQDDESDLIMYPYRPYKASTGTWLCKDPLGEPGFELVADKALVANRQKTISAQTLQRIKTVLSAIWDRDPQLEISVEAILAKNGLDAQKLMGAENPSSQLNVWPLDEDKELSLYAFVANNPVNEVDGTGLVKIYGNWCGPDWTGGKKEEYTPHPPGYYAAPTDNLDSACQTHDICYYNCRQKFPCDPAARSQCFRNCDYALTKAAYAIGGFWGRVIGAGIDRPGTRDPGPNGPCCPNGKKGK